MNGFIPRYRELLLILPLTFGCLTATASAQIIPDRTLPSNSTVTPSGDASAIEGGTQMGTNLFHSFQEFSLPTGGTAFFNNSLDIQNIFSRVTGRSISNIDGIIKANGTANLFLINPNGIIFGSNAQLNIGGSFLASTANGILFDDRTSFSAINPATSSLLTISVPLGLQFSNAGAIAVQGANLSVPTSRTLALIGGDITISGNNNPRSTGITAGGFPLVTVQEILVPTTPGGRIELGSVISGNVGIAPTDKGFALNYIGSENFGNIQLSGGANVEASGTGGGEIKIQARNFQIGGSRIASFTYGSLPGGNITVNTSESVELIGTGGFAEAFQQIVNFTTGPGGFRNGLFNLSFGAGNAGDIVINTERFIAKNGAFAIVSSIAAGQGGNLTLNATESVEAISSGLISGNRPRSTGDAGNLIINTRNLILQDRAIATASTAGFGRGGNLNVEASESIKLTGGEPYFILGILSNTIITTSSLGTGAAGDLQINTGRLTLEGGAAIGANTFAQGNGGRLEIDATQSIEVAGELYQGLATNALTTRSSGTGDAGGIWIATPSLLLRDYSIIAIDSIGSGSAGNLEINADLLRLENHARISGATAVGDRSNITVNARSLQLRDNSEITTNARNVANGGNITLNVDTLSLLENSHITANAVRGRGGNIQINSSNLFRSPDSAIAASSELGISGVVEIQTPDINVQNAFATLESNFAIPDAALASSCLTRRDGEQNRFTVTGTGGLPDTPYEALSSRYNVTRVRLLSEVPPQPLELTDDKPWKEGDPIVEARSIVRTADGSIMLVAQQYGEAIVHLKDLVCEVN